MGNRLEDSCDRKSDATKVIAEHVLALETVLLFIFYLSDSVTQWDSVWGKFPRQCKFNSAEQIQQIKPSKSNQIGTILHKNNINEKHEKV